MLTFCLSLLSVFASVLLPPVCGDELIGTWRGKPLARHTQLGFRGRYGSFTRAQFFEVVSAADTVRVFEPLGGGCGRGKSTVKEAAKEYGCDIAVNGALFNTSSFDCFSNVVTNGIPRVVKQLGNVHFGVKKDGSLFMGYLNVSDVVNLKTNKTPFKELIGGAIWLVENGTNVVERSAAEEDISFQETGRGFVSVRSARTALGYDKDGRLLLMAVEGKTWTDGVNLYELADQMIEMGAVMAMNLDGGGSTTAVVYDGLVTANYPSDMCTQPPKNVKGSDGEWVFAPVDEPFGRCEREVTTLVCAIGDREEQEHNGEDEQAWTGAEKMATGVLVVNALLFGVGGIAICVAAVRRRRGRYGSARKHQRWSMLPTTDEDGDGDASEFSRASSLGSLGRMGEAVRTVNVERSEETNGGQNLIGSEEEEEEEEDLFVAGAHSPSAVVEMQGGAEERNSGKEEV
uniref:Phosphodiester glycosidase domain-containing protein n=1 Tax=Palpitomonas bilix TaxID=652834 RepID=A0A7S3DJ58_9EUKA|mmetsp:Transcript_39302/g.100718  ORF Transcript_39302/g.100718 Transcript_39302/m.100718 type:complete len:458 (+) Transcript_39302:114-1487(+)